MLPIVLWALGTGFVTGAVWFAIVFFRRHPAQDKSPALPAPGQPDAKTVENMSRRLLELEERVDANEYILKRDKVAQPRKPPSQ
jgi:hypothetical protein